MLSTATASVPVPSIVWVRELKEEGGKLKLTGADAFKISGANDFADLAEAIAGRWASVKQRTTSPFQVYKPNGDEWEKPDEDQAVELNSKNSAYGFIVPTVL